MASLKLLERNTDAEPISRSSSISPTKGLGSRTRLAKIGRLSAAKCNRLIERGNSQYFDQVVGLPILHSTNQPSRRSPRISRERKLVTNLSRSPQYYQHMLTEDGARSEDLPRHLSITGERLTSVSSISPTLRTSPLVRRRYYPSSSSSSSSSTDYSQCSGCLSPCNPPPSPIPHYSNTLKLDGCRLSYPKKEEGHESKDFKPGLLRKSSYCCSKCEGRMVTHDSHIVESSPCPFSSYFRYHNTAHDELGFEEGSDTDEEDLVFLQRDTPILPELFQRGAEKKVSDAVIETFRGKRRSPIKMPSFSSRDESFENEEILLSTCLSAILVSSREYNKRNRKANIRRTIESYSRFDNPANECTEDTHPEANEVSLEAYYTEMLDFSHEDYVSVSSQQNTHQLKEDLRPSSTFSCTHNVTDELAYLHNPGRNVENEISASSPSKTLESSPCKTSATSPCETLEPSVGETLESSPNKTPCETSDSSSCKTSTSSLGKTSVSSANKKSVSSPGKTYVSTMCKTLVSTTGKTSVFTPGKKSVSSANKKSVSSPGKTSVSNPGKTSVFSPGETYSSEAISDVEMNAATKQVTHTKTFDLFKQASDCLVYGRNRDANRGTKSTEPNEEVSNNVIINNLGKQQSKKRPYRVRNAGQDKKKGLPKSLEIFYPGSKHIIRDTKRKEQYETVGHSFKQEIIGGRELESTKVEANLKVKREDTKVTTTSTDKKNDLEKEQNKQSDKQEVKILSFVEPYTLVQKEKENFKTPLKSDTQKDKLVESKLPIPISQKGTKREAEIPVKQTSEVKTGSETKHKSQSQQIELAKTEDLTMVINAKKLELPPKTELSMKQLEQEPNDARELTCAHESISDDPRSLSERKNKPELERENSSLLRCNSANTPQRILGDINQFRHKKLFSKEEFFRGTRGLDPSAMLQDIIRECTYAMEEQVGEFLPDISSCKKVYYQPVTDKRYNRWKRRKRKKGKQTRRRKNTGSPEVSSEEDEDVNEDDDDEISDSSKAETSPKFKLICCNETVQKLLGPNQAYFCASSIDRGENRMLKCTKESKSKDENGIISDEDVEKFLQGNYEHTNSASFLKSIDETVFARKRSSEISPDIGHPSSMPEIQAEGGDNEASVQQASRIQKNETSGTRVCKSEVHENPYPKYCKGEDGGYTEQNNRSKSDCLEGPYSVVYNKNVQSNEDKDATWDKLRQQAASTSALTTEVIDDSLTDYTDVSAEDRRRSSSSLETTPRSPRSVKPVLMAPNMEQSMLKLAKQHLHKNQSLSNKKYSDGQLKSKLPNIRDMKLKQGSPWRQSNNYRNILNKFVRPLEGQDLITGSRSYMKNDAPIIQTLRLSQKKDTKQSLPNRPQLQASQEGSKKKNMSTTQDVSLLTLGNLLETMPGNDVSQGVNKKGKSKEIFLLDKQLPTINAQVKKANELTRAPTKEKVNTENINKITDITYPLSLTHQERSVSNLSFSRAFTFSVFDLPEDYRKKNNDLERRARTALRA